MDENSAKESYIIFQIDGTFYGISGKYVLQLEMMQEITPVPDTPGYMEGVMFSRGEVIPVINLRVRFGLQKKNYDASTRIIVIKNGDRVAGLIADNAREYININSTAIHPVPLMYSAKEGSFVESVARTADRMILILNLKEIIEYMEKHEITS
jgi:purine-binding chemotaxis protein CheW